LTFTARPEIESVPDSQNYVAFKTVDRNKNGQVEESEWEWFRARVAEMAQDHGLLALRPGGDSAKPDGNSVKIVWRESTSIPEVPSPVLYQGRLYLIRNGGVATCLDAATGKVIYRARVGAPGAYYASPVIAGGRVYLASSEGVVTVLATGTDQLKVLSRNALGEDIVATPAIAGKAIYVRTLKNLYAFGDR
jgi:outer membrane protein assembly factor BamB